MMLFLKDLSIRVFKINKSGDMSNYKDITVLLVGIVIEPLVRLIPRNKRKWAFGAMLSFRDNPKYLFYWTNEKHPEIRSICISHNKQDVDLLRSQGFEAYYKWSLKGIYHALTAKVYICDHQLGDINFYFSGGVFYVNLWHGSSMKRVRWQAPEYFMQKHHLRDANEIRTSLRVRILEYPILFRSPDLCLAPSTVQAKEFFAPMMNIPLEKCIVGVYPRSRLLLEGKESALDFIRKYESSETANFVKELERYDKTHIYMPTWRNDNSDFIAQSGLDWERLNHVMKERNELFILKLHPLTKLDAPSIGKYSNIKLYPAKSDIYAVLPFIDTLITDYSSIYTDFLTMDKEVILFVFDYDSYVKKSYDLSEYDKYFVGVKAYNFESLLTLLEKGHDCHIPQAERKRLLDFFWDSHEKNIDLIEEIKKRLK